MKGYIDFLREKYCFDSKIISSSNSSCFTYLSHNGNKKMVFKFPKANKKHGKISSWNVNHIKREIDLLNFLEDFPSIPKLNHSFKCEGYSECAFCRLSHGPTYLVRDYVEGKETNGKRKIIGSDNKKTIIDVVLFLHENGYSNLDLLHPGNVLIDLNGRPWIVDLGSAIKIGETIKYDDNSKIYIDSSKFREFKRYDFQDITKLCA